MREIYKTPLIKKINISKMVANYSFIYFTNI